MWNLPGPGLEPVSPALAGGFLITAPPGKPPIKDDWCVGNCSSGGPQDHRQVQWFSRRAHRTQKSCYTPGYVFLKWKDTDSNQQKAESRRDRPSVSSCVWTALNSPSNDMWQHARRITNQGRALKPWCLGFGLTLVPSLFRGHISIEWPKAPTRSHIVSIHWHVPGREHRALMVGCQQQKLWVAPGVGWGGRQGTNKPQPHFIMKCFCYFHFSFSQMMF